MPRAAAFSNAVVLVHGNVARRWWRIEVIRLGSTSKQTQFADAENSQRKHERYDVIEQPEEQETGQQIFLVELPQRHQHGGIENAQAARRMAGESKQRRRNENHCERDKADIRLVR